MLDELSIYTYNTNISYRCEQLASQKKRHLLRAPVKNITMAPATPQLGPMHVSGMKAAVPHRCSSLQHNSKGPSEWVVEPSIFLVFHDFRDRPKKNHDLKLASKFWAVAFWQWTWEGDPGGFFWKSWGWFIDDIFWPDSCKIWREEFFIFFSWFGLVGLFARSGEVLWFLIQDNLQ